MEIRLRPELAELIKRDFSVAPTRPWTNLWSKPFPMLHEQEAWLAANRADFQTKIAEGYASAQRRELIGPDEVRAKLAELKRARSSHQQG